MAGPSLLVGNQDVVLSPELRVAYKDYVQTAGKSDPNWRDGELLYK